MDYSSWNKEDLDEVQQLGVFLVTCCKLLAGNDSDAQ